MRRLRILAFLAVWLLLGCGPAPSATPSTPSRPTGSASVEASPSAQPGTAGACRAAERRQSELRGSYGSAYSPEQGPEGGHVAVGLIGPPAELDPLRVASPSDVLLANATWRGLVRLTSDYKVVGDLATVPPSLDNGLVRVAADGSMAVQWCLRETAWSDGVALTCADYQYTLRWLADVEPEIAGRFGPVVSLDCATPLLGVLRYRSVFEGYYTRPLPPLPRHVLDGLPLADLRAGRPFEPGAITRMPTSGPFRISRFVEDGPIELVRNDGYRGGSGGRAARLDGLSLVPFPSASALIGAFRAGEVQLAAGLGAGEIPELEAIGLANSIAAFPGLGYESLVPNLAGETGTRSCSTSSFVADRGIGCPTHDPAIRLAIERSIDRQAVADELGPRDEEQLVAGVVVPQSWFFTDIPPPTQDLAAARGALDAAGWRDRNGDGIRERNGLEARIELCTSDDAGHAAAARLIAAEVAPVGISITPHVVARVALEEPYRAATPTSPCALSRGNFDLALVLVQTSLDPIEYRTRYHSSSFEPAGHNIGQIALPEIDRSLDIAASTVDFSTIKDAMVALQQAIAAAAIEIPISAPRVVDLVGEPPSGATVIGNYFSSPTASATWNAEDWYRAPAVPTPRPAASQLP